MSKTAIVCSGGEPAQLFPTFVFAASAAALGEEVLVFCCPAAAPAMLKGNLEEMEAKDLKVDDLREGVELVGVTTFLVESADASRTFCF